MDKGKFFNTLATALESGMPLKAALDLQAGGASSRHLCQRLIAAVDRGATLAEACRRESALNLFDVAMIEAAERSGQLEKGCRQLASRYETMFRLRFTAIMSMIYPLYLLGIFGIAIVLMVVGSMVSCAFRPILVQAIVFPIVILAVLGALFTPFFWFPRGERPGLQRLFLALPFPWFSYIRCTVYHSFVTNLRYLYAAGIPISEALALAARATEIVIIRDAVLPYTRQLATGASLESCLPRLRVLPEEICQALVLGERTGTIEQALERVEGDYAFKLAAIVKQLPLIFSLVAGLLLIAGIVLIIVQLIGNVFGAYSQIIDQL